MMLIEETAPAAEALPVAALRAHLRLAQGFEGPDDAASHHNDQPSSPRAVREP